MINKQAKPSWTPSQEEAIVQTGCQLLVAAGAGSGKTSVLTQRILEKLKSGKDIKDFLVVTFTVASAEDMKEKLRKKLFEEYSTNPENKHLSNQIAKLPFARISTITSFCLDLVKKNFTSLGLSPSVRIADESESGALFENAMDILLDEMFEEKNPLFHTVLSASGCRGKEKSLEKYLLKIYNKLRSHPNYIKLLNELSYKFEIYANNSNDLSSLLKTPIGELLKLAADIIVSSCERELPTMCEIAEAYGGKLEEKTNEIYSFFNQGKAFAEAEKYSECSDAFYALSKVSFMGNPFKNVSPEEKAIYNAFREDLKKKSEKAVEFFSNISENALNDIKICSEIMKGLKELLIRLDRIYLDLKREKCVLDFTDAEQFAYSLLIDENGTPTQLCKEIGASTEEVLVDEYQDTNPLQDAIFSVLATKDNRFMVGDDKQSIYRFRNAFPDIFNRYKKTFNNDKAKCIRLRENFRCSKEIIDFTNIVFDFLWGESYEKERLIFAKDKNKTKSETDKLVTVKTFQTKFDNNESSVFEAKYIGKEILSLMESYKTEKGENLKFSDIAILLPVTRGVGSIFFEVLQNMGIPVTTNKQGALTEAPEIKLVLSILKAICNPEEDIPLASAMNSFFFGFTADELAKIRKNKNSSLFGSVLKYSEEKNENVRKYSKRMILRKKEKSVSVKKDFISNRKTDRELKAKCRNFIIRLEELRIKGRQMECKQLIWELYENEGILSTMECAEDGETKKGNLLLLYTDAIEFGRREYKTLSAFLKHADKIETSAYAPEDANSVSIMTIHGSKGLEFPICFLANAGKTLGKGGFGEKKPILSLEYGIFTPLKDSSLSTRTPSFYSAAEIIEKPEETEEEKRKLYVALTRAREKLYIVGSCGESEFIKETYPNECKNYLGWILTAHPDGTYINEAIDETINIETQDFSNTEKTAYFENEEEVIYDDDEENFIYPYEASVKIPRKLSVSQLKEAENNEYTKSVRKKDFISVPPFAKGKKKISGAEIGTANHTFMQFASFENCLSFGVEAEGERLLLKGMITEEQYGMLNFKSLKAFFQSNVFSEISSSKKVFREKRFTVSDNSKELLGVGNETVLVQGVIDLFFQNNDGTYTVVDYKTDKIKSGEENILIERYKGQLSYYAKAVEEITQQKTTRGIIYSFALNKEIEVPLNR